MPQSNTYFLTQIVHAYSKAAMGFHFEYVTQKFVLVRVALLDHFEMLLEEIIAQTRS